MWHRQESNLYQKLRKLLFYPLNYDANSMRIMVALVGIEPASKV